MKTGYTLRIIDKEATDNRGCFRTEEEAKRFYSLMKDNPEYKGKKVIIEKEDFDFDDEEWASVGYSEEFYQTIQRI